MSEPAKATERAAPDWPRLTAICDEAERLRVAGQLDQTEFKRLLGEAKEACHGHPEFVEALAPYKPAS
jgi:hypothetical protein